MERNPVKSSNIKAVGYDPATEQLEIEFHPKGDAPPRVYVYDKVPYDKYRTFLNAPSLGSHFATHIRANYESHRIDSPVKGKSHGQKEAGEEGNTEETES